MKLLGSFLVALAVLLTGALQPMESAQASQVNASAYTLSTDLTVSSTQSKLIAQGRRIHAKYFATLVAKYNMYIKNHEKTKANAVARKIKTTYKSLSPSQKKAYKAFLKSLTPKVTTSRSYKCAYRLCPQSTLAATNAGCWEQTNTITALMPYVVQYPLPHYEWAKAYDFNVYFSYCTSSDGKVTYFFAKTWSSYVMPVFWSFEGNTSEYQSETGFNRLDYSIQAKYKLGIPVIEGFAPVIDAYPWFSVTIYGDGSAPHIEWKGN